MSTARELLCLTANLPSSKRITTLDFLITSCHNSIFFVYVFHRQTTLARDVTLFWDSSKGRLNWSRKMFHKNFKPRCFFSKIHFMNSQINKVHSSTIFCAVLSDLMGFWDASISHLRRCSTVKCFVQLVSQCFGDIVAGTSCTKHFTV